MRHTLIIFALLIFFKSLYCQNTNHIGQLILTNAKVKNVDTVMESICKESAKTLKFTISARTIVQLSCDYGDPSKNIYDTVDNEVDLFYLPDTTGKLYYTILNDIKSYFLEKGQFDYPLKSFYVNGSMITPSISTFGERIGDYKLFYFDNSVYKIVLRKSEGFGCLSSFIDENMYFTKDGKQINLGKYIENVEFAKRIAYGK